MRQEAINNFKHSIEARRPLLERLFRTARDEWESSERLPAGEKHTAALWLSQDAANSLMLILGYALFRFMVDSTAVTPCKIITTKTHMGATATRVRVQYPGLRDNLQKLGPEAYNNVRLGGAIAALADVARHLHEFRDGATPSAINQRILETLNIDRKHDHAAALFLHVLAHENPSLASYNDFHKAILSIAE